MSSIQIIGDEKLQRILKSIPKKLRPRIIRQAARAAARPIIDSARSKVPVEDGDLKRAIKYKSSKSKDWPGGFVCIDKRNRGFEIMKGTVMAFGAKKERKTKKGASRGNIKRPIRDFIKEAGEDSGIEARHILESKLLRIIEKQLNKA